MKLYYYIFHILYNLTLVFSMASDLSKHYYFFFKPSKFETIVFFKEQITTSQSRLLEVEEILKSLIKNPHDVHFAPSTLSSEFSFTAKVNYFLFEIMI
jgi:hypothetical protein